MSPSGWYLLILFATSLTFFHAQGQTVTGPSSVCVNETDGVVIITLTNDDPVTAWGGSVSLINYTAVQFMDFGSLDDSTFFEPAGSETTQITIIIIDDEEYEHEEHFIVSVTGLSTGTPDFNITVKIKSEDRKPVDLQQIDELYVKEDIGYLNFTIHRNDTTTFDFNVTVSTMDSSATAGDDYTPLSYVLISFDEDEVYVTVQIHITDDTLAEEDETFCVTIHGTQIADNITFYVTIHDNDTPDNFNCRRGKSQPCLNGGTCLNNGTCMCPDDTEGENCGILTPNINTGCGCVNGTCVDNGIEMSCVCDGGFAGELCDQPAYFVKCEGNGFSICITPFSVDTFHGLIYVLGQFANPDCVLTRADPDNDIVEGCNGYVAFIEYNGTCGNFEIETGDEPDMYQVELRVQYDKSTLRFTDEIVTFTCTSSNDTHAGFRINVNNDDSHNNVQRGDGSFAPAILTVTDHDNDAVGDTVKIGENLYFCISVAEVTSFNGVVIDRIEVQNDRSGDDHRYLLLYDEGCFLEGFGTITSPGFIPATARHTMCFSMEIFIFSSDMDLPIAPLTVYIHYSVFENADNATQHECSARKKRQAVEMEQDKAKKTFIVINPEPLTSESLQDVSSTCSNSSWLVPALIGLGIVAITMAVVIIVLTIVVCRHYKEKKMP